MNDYNEGTLMKVYNALRAAGITGTQVADAVNEMRSQGILFSERPPDSDDPRDAIHHAIQDAANKRGIHGNGVILTGYVIATAWMDSEGDRWLGRSWSATTAFWEAKGMMHEALHGCWPDDKTDWEGQ